MRDDAVVTGSGTEEQEKGGPVRASPDRAPSPPAVRVTFVILVILSVACGVLILFVDVPPPLVGGLVLLMAVSMLLVNVPIGIALIGPSILGLYALGGIRMMEASIREIPYNSVATWSLSVVPLFVLLGIIISRAGIANGAFTAMRQWFGWLPGGLAVASNMGGAVMAASSGSSVGISYAVGRMALPQMLRSGYKPGLATSSIITAGTLGQIIPPSVLLVVYAGVVEVPVGPQLIAGIVPGAILALVFSGLVVARVLIQPSLAPKADMTDVTWRSRLASLLSMLPLVVVIGAVIVGMMTGFVTPTESAAIGALMAVLMALVPIEGRRTKLSQLPKLVGTSVVESVPAITAIMVVLIGSFFLTRVLTLSRAAEYITQFLSGLDLNRVGFLLLLIVFYIVIGMFLDTLPTILLTVPLLQPVLAAMGVDMMWFGIFVIMLVEVGMITPPVGMLLYVVHNLLKDPTVNPGPSISLWAVLRGVLPSIIAIILVLIVFIFFPDIITWLPNALPVG